MSVVSRALAALTAASALLVGLLATSASAGTANSPAPVADPPPSIAQLCAATGDQSIDELLAGVSETDLAGALAPLLTLTVPQDQGRVLKADVDLADVRTALGCPSSTPTSTTTAPPTTTSSAPRDDKDCSDFSSQGAAQAYYDKVATPDDPDPSKLDGDGDGKACEPGEGSSATGSGAGSNSATQDDGSTATTGGGQIVDVPEGSASTGE